MKRQAPCKGCENRRQGCHTTCKLYLDYAEMNNKRMEEDHKRKVEVLNVRRSISDGRERMKKSRATNRIGG